jgi:acetolactate synthase-1/2/3 large subunit
MAEAWSDSSPVVLLAGQIDAAFDGSGRGILHETPDQGRSFEAITAFVGRPRTTDAVPAAVGDALRSAMTGRWRPAYVELPTDLLTQPFAGDVPAVDFPGPSQPDPAAVVAAARVLSAARRVVIVPGAGVQRARASAELRRLAARLDAPVLMPMTGAGAIPADDPMSAGILNPGRDECRSLLEEADAVLVVGCRLDDVQTAHWTLPLANLVQIDVDPAAIGRSYPVAAGIAGDACLALEGLLDELGTGPAAGDGNWGAGRARAAREGSLSGVSAAERAVRDAFLGARAALPRDAILTHDAARLNSWSGYIWPVYEPDGSIWPWGSATLGFALGAANGAAIAAPGRRVVASCGDGGFLFTAMELATAVAHQLDVTVFIHDDSAFGSIASYQIRHHGRAYATDLVNPDLLAFARSFGVPAQRVESVDELPAAMARATADAGPSVVILAGPLDQPWS